MKLKKALSALCLAAMLASLTACTSTNQTASSSALQSSESSNSSSEAQSSESTVQSDTETSAASSETIESTSKTIESGDDLDEQIQADIKASVDVLNADYEQYKKDIDTFDEYVDNTDEVEAFYAKIGTVSKELCCKMYEYSLSYAQTVLSSDGDNKDKYRDIQDIYDYVYDDAGEEIYNAIYDGILSDMYDDYYDGILADAYDTVEYEDYYQARSDEYDLYSDARSEAYDDYSDARSDVYDFYSDIRSELYSGDTDKAQKKVDKFKKDVEKAQQAANGED